jgi:hypothetical protein
MVNKEEWRVVVDGVSRRSIFKDYRMKSCVHRVEKKGFSKNL